MSFIVVVQTGRGAGAKGNVYEIDDDNAMRACGKAKKKFACHMGVRRKDVRVMKCLKKGA
jgi:hypothetical protein